MDAGVNAWRFLKWHVGSVRGWGPGLTPPILDQTQTDGFLELESGETYFCRFLRHFSTRIKRIWRIFLFFFVKFAFIRVKIKKRQCPVWNRRHERLFADTNENAAVTSFRRPKRGGI